jgi:eukaryotic-like serine/threonine-protein kinase
MDALASRAVEPRTPSGAGVAPRYWAFLSYSHRDARQAEWLHRSLETYRIPKPMVGRTTAAGPIPDRLAPIFRDRDELGAARDLSAEIEAALRSARNLVVVCSPAAAASRWTDLEIATFKRLHPDRPIFAVIVSGEPFASDLPGREAEECFPPALRHRFDPRGRITRARAEPIAADLRDQGDGRRLAKLKLVAGMLDVPLDDLARREAGRRSQRLGWLAAASVAGMVVTSGLAVSAVLARNEARAQRTEAEGLIEFMLTDLRAKLEPVGRLDALDSVGGRALAYYGKQNLTELDADSLGRRSRALHLIGDLSDRRGDLPGALKRFEEAAATTSEALRRAPKDGARIFDHSQSVYYVGYIAWQRGEVAHAERRFREYRRLAERLVAIDPANRDWRMELSYADTNLGTLLLEDGRPGDAAAAFERSLAIKREVAAEAPADLSRQTELARAIGWVSTAHEQQGLLDRALRDKQAESDAYRAILAKTPGDSVVKRSLVASQRSLGRLHLSRGEVSISLDLFNRAAQLADSLVLLEPANTGWLEMAASVHGDLAEALIDQGETEAARPHVRRATDIGRELAARDHTVVFWTGHLTHRALWLQAALHAREGRAADALRLASAASAGLAKAYAGRKPEPEALWAQVRARLLVGDQSRALGDISSARTAWADVVAWTQDTEDSRRKALRAIALQRLGRGAEANRIAAELQRANYREPTFSAAFRELSRPRA